MIPVRRRAQRLAQVDAKGLVPEVAAVAATLALVVVLGVPAVAQEVVRMVVKILALGRAETVLQLVTNNTVLLVKYLDALNNGNNTDEIAEEVYSRILNENGLIKISNALFRTFVSLSRLSPDKQDVKNRFVCEYTKVFKDKFINICDAACLFDYCMQEHKTDDILIAVSEICKRCAIEKVRRHIVLTLLNHIVMFKNTTKEPYRSIIHELLPIAEKYDDDSEQQYSFLDF